MDQGCFMRYKIVFLAKSPNRPFNFCFICPYSFAGHSPYYTRNTSKKHETIDIYTIKLGGGINILKLK